MRVIEEKLAHLDKTVEDLSDVVARQQSEITMLARRVQLLMEREAERESQAQSSVHIADSPPPHW
ncbi:SlyX family protein [Pseudooceanicola sp.]|uniref:SlyX family protein n=1 Tax=Pseudooceanicola sp. TaxID=1914328 RepID=UPI00262E4B2A|nr:SlyX family protein [Pseudooceanicola sp.]MDF1854717.1 SlyX family protein [Pseudooceanicola sp.]